MGNFNGEKGKATSHKDRLTALHVICLHIFRHISQKCSCIHKVCTPLFVSSDKKSDGASDAQSLCGVAVNLFFEIAMNLGLIIAGEYAIMRKRFVGEECGENEKESETTNWHREL